MPIMVRRRLLLLLLNKNMNLHHRQRLLSYSPLAAHATAAMVTQSNHLVCKPRVYVIIKRMHFSLLDAFVNTPGQQWFEQSSSLSKVDSKLKSALEKMVEEVEDGERRKSFLFSWPGTMQNGQHQNGKAGIQSEGIDESGRG